MCSSARDRVLRVRTPRDPESPSRPMASARRREARHARHLAALALGANVCLLELRELGLEHRGHVQNKHSQKYRRFLIDDALAFCYEVGHAEGEQTTSKDRALKETRLQETGCKGAAEETPGRHGD